MRGCGGDGEVNEQVIDLSISLQSLVVPPHLGYFFDEVPATSYVVVNKNDLDRLAFSRTRSASHDRTWHVRITFLFRHGLLDLMQSGLFPSNSMPFTGPRIEMVNESMTSVPHTAHRRLVSISPSVEYCHTYALP